MRLTLDVHNSADVAKEVVAAYVSQTCSPSSSLRMLSEAISSEATRLARLGLMADSAEYGARAKELAELAKAWRTAEETTFASKEAAE